MKIEKTQLISIKYTCKLVKTAIYMIVWKLRCK